MDSRYDTYGVKATPLEGVASRVQQLLGVQLEERDSSYYAGTYYLYEKAYGRELKLYSNYDSVGGFWIRSQYRDYAVILEVSDLDNMDEIQQKLMGGLEDVVLLRSKVLPAVPPDEDEE